MAQEKMAAGTTGRTANTVFGPGAGQPLHRIVNVTTSGAEKTSSRGQRNGGGHSLDMNAAVRATHYSPTAGSDWKVGAPRPSRTCAPRDAVAKFPPHAGDLSGGRLAQHLTVHSTEICGDTEFRRAASELGPEKSAIRGSGRYQPHVRGSASRSTTNRVKKRTR